MHWMTAGQTGDTGTDGSTGYFIEKCLAPVGAEKRHGERITRTA